MDLGDVPPGFVFQIWFQIRRDTYSDISIIGGVWGTSDTSPAVTQTVLMPYCIIGVSNSLTPNQQWHRDNAGAVTWDITYAKSAVLQVAASKNM